MSQHFHNEPKQVAQSPSSRRVYARKGVTLMEIMIVVTIIGLLLGILMPAMKRIRDATHASEIKANLKVFAYGAQQYLLNEGATEARLSDFEGQNNYVRSIKPIYGEDYSTIVVTFETTSISVTDSEGVAHTYNF